MSMPCSYVNHYGLAVMLWMNSPSSSNARSA
jgi:hypothetical protein